MYRIITSDYIINNIKYFRQYGKHIILEPPENEDLLVHDIYDDEKDHIKRVPMWTIYVVKDFDSFTVHVYNKEGEKYEYITN